MEDLSVLKKVVERSDELNSIYGEGNWRIRTVTNSGGRVFLALTKELRHLGTNGGEKVVVATVTVDGKRKIIIEKL